MNSKNIGRIAFFKYIGLTLLILIGILFLLVFVSPELKKLVYRNLINPYLNDTAYFSVQIIIDLMIAYFIAGKIGQSIVDNHKNPFMTTFIGFLKIWMGILLVAMISEMIPRLIEYGINPEFIGLSILIWLIMGGPLFLLIGAAQGGLISFFIGKEIENQKNALQQRI